MWGTGGLRIWAGCRSIPSAIEHLKLLEVEWASQRPCAPGLRPRPDRGSRRQRIGRQLGACVLVDSEQEGKPSNFGPIFPETC